MHALAYSVFGFALAGIIGISIDYGLYLANRRVIQVAVSFESAHWSSNGKCLYIDVPSPITEYVQGYATSWICYQDREGSHANEPLERIYRQPPEIKKQAPERG